MAALGWSGHYHPALRLPLRTSSHSPQVCFVVFNGLLTVAPYMPLWCSHVPSATSVGVNVILNPCGFASLHLATCLQPWLCEPSYG